MTQVTEINELCYRPDSADLFRHLTDLPWPVFLDSARPYCDQGRYDILSADPYVTLSTHGMETRIDGDGPSRSSGADPLELLQGYLDEVPQEPCELPFAGGALGYLGYDLGRRFETLPVLAEAEVSLPDMAVGLYDWCVLVDHRQQRSWLLHQPHGRRPDYDLAAIHTRLQLKDDAAPRDPFRVVSDIRHNMQRQDYARAFARIQRYILEGDCYQVNLTQRFSADVQGDPWLAYARLRQLNPAPFAAYMQTPEGAVLSSSPERFLRLTGDAVETRPIKGTRPRSADPDEDREQALALQNSLKDRAENVMIVDLLRNDLGRTCRTGTVRVPELFTLESFATVHHLVSTVTGLLDEQASATDLLRASFPGGSITGAPKLRAMEIIEELEPQWRSIYCGAIGYIGFNGNMDTNIAIRTLAMAAGRMHCWAGGGIVRDSTEPDEYQESLDKAAAMLALYREFSDAGP